MAQKTNSTGGKAGLPPGALVHVGKRKAENVKVSFIDYDSNEINEKDVTKIEDIFKLKATPTVSWINIDGLHDTNLIAKVGKNFGLHPLLIEDILNTNHRPKAEIYDNLIFVTLKMLGLSKDSKSVVSEQVSIVLGENYVISFQEREGDLFNIIRERLRNNLGTIRQMGSDYLMYRLIDTIVDNYFFVTDYYADQIEDLEIQVLESPSDDMVRIIQMSKKQLIQLRKATNPLREVLSLLEKDPTPLIKKETDQYLRDVHEHIVQINDVIDTQRDMLSGLMDLYMSGVSNKMNEVMKVLTIIATIFIPLTFIAGIYGMNFKHMPELEMPYGYYSVWGLMIAIFIGMIIYFKRKGWL